MAFVDVVCFDSLDKLETVVAAVIYDVTAQEVTVADSVVDGRFAVFKFVSGLAFCFVAV